MADRDTQLHPAREGGEKGLDRNGRNQVRPQTQEPYGDQELAVETKVTHERHYAGQPLETVADREANEDVRRERYERAKVDPAFARSEKIDVDEDDREDWEANEPFSPFNPSAPLVSPVPDEVDGEDKSERSRDGHTPPNDNDNR